MKQLDSQRLNQTLRRVVNDVEQLLQTMAEATGERVGDFRTRTGRQLSDARDRLGAMERQTSRQLRHASRETRSYVKGHPWQALAGVAAVAVAVALVSRRRH